MTTVIKTYRVAETAASTRPGTGERHAFIVADEVFFGNDRLAFLGGTQMKEAS